MKSLFAQYCEERFGSQTIEEPWGFIAFRTSGELCMIQDFHVIPEERGKGHGHELLKRAAEACPECTNYWAQVCLSDKGANTTMAMALHVGFQMLTAEGNRIILIKEIVR